jgi:hypothetical protein
MAIKNNFFTKFFVSYFLKLHSHHFSEIKIHEEVTKQGEGKNFLAIFAG